MSEEEKPAIVLTEGAESSDSGGEQKCSQQDLKLCQFKGNKVSELAFERAPPKLYKLHRLDANPAVITYTVRDGDDDGGRRRKQEVYENEVEEMGNIKQNVVVR